MRIFVAYAIDEQTINRISEVQTKLIPIYQNGRFKQPKNMHMTIKFLGEVTEIQLNQLTTEIDNIIGQYSSLTVNLDHLGFFGSSAKKHTLWIGCESQMSMNRLSEEVKDCALKSGILCSETPFVPHITLAQHGTLLESLPQIDTITIKFDKICIFLSSRIKNELVYQPIKCWIL